MEDKKRLIIGGILNFVSLLLSIFLTYYTYINTHVSVKGLWFIFILPIHIYMVGIMSYILLLIFWEYIKIEFEGFTK